MSGHSKWSTIKHKKALLDSRRGKSWSKCARAITMAAKSGGNPNDNPKLRLAIDKAKSENMPKDTIEKAIKKGTGELEGESYEELHYEGYGSGGVAIMARVLTDNRARTSAEIKKIFERAGGSLGSPNCVAFQFTQKGSIVVNRDQAPEDRMMELALEAGADDVSTSEHIYEITCSPEEFHHVKHGLERAGITVQSADLAMIANTPMSLDLEHARKIMRLIDALEEQDDVQSVYSNSDISDDVVNALAKD
ncbi:MAG: YebC/PmpR family DNA-binding transcriptional regulator [Planctomycetes bacterium]|nr:YebC/PmpR family DNA-binding transcriptional regulator [Planctomycetota bacterium]MBI3835885.1 YebC/PmpR family DNA-binding transcriptional regulator [Planctomycetota bacterium]